MPRPFPPAHHHKSSGQARVKHAGRHHYLGPWGSPQAAQKYEQLRARLMGGGAAIEPRAGLTVGELVAAFWVHARQHYRLADGTPSSEINDYRQSLKELLALHSGTAVASFGPLALKEIRQAMLTLPRTAKRRRKLQTPLKRPSNAPQTPAQWVEETVVLKVGLCRKTINQRIDRIRRVFRWGAENELVPAAVSQALATVRGLQAGRTAARESAPVKPAPRQHVEAVVAVLTDPVRAMVELQLLTGMRPGEVIAMRMADLDMAGEVWVYRPVQHKTAWRGHEREILLGPKAQEVLRRVLGKGLRVGCLFRPRKRPGYTRDVYGNAVIRACERAGVPRFRPNQIRHLVATEVRKTFGLEAAQVALGHKRADITQVYAERDREKGVEVARKIG